MFFLYWQILPIIMSRLRQPEDIRNCRLTCKPWCNAIDDLFKSAASNTVESGYWTNKMCLELDLNPNDATTATKFQYVCSRIHFFEQPRKPRFFARKLVVTIQAIQREGLYIFQLPQVVSVLSQVQHLEIRHVPAYQEYRITPRMLAINSTPRFYLSLLSNMINLQELTLDIISDSLTGAIVNCDTPWPLSRIRIRSKVDNRDTLNDQFLLGALGDWELVYYSSPALFTAKSKCHQFSGFETLTELFLPGLCGKSVLDMLSKVSGLKIEKLGLVCCCDVSSLAKKLHEFSIAHKGLCFVQLRLVAVASNLSDCPRYQRYYYCNNDGTNNADIVLPSLSSSSSSSNAAASALESPSSSSNTAVSALESPSSSIASTLESSSLPSSSTSSRLKCLEILCHGVIKLDCLSIFKSVEKIVLCCFGKRNLIRLYPAMQKVNKYQRRLLVLFGYCTSNDMKPVWELMPSLMELEQRVYHSSLRFYRSNDSRMIGHLQLTRSMFENLAATRSLSINDDDESGSDTTSSSSSSSRSSNHSATSSDDDDDSLVSSSSSSSSEAWAEDSDD